MHTACQPAYAKAMRNLVLVTLIAVLLLVSAVYTEAITVTPNGVNADVSFTEPTTNADGTPLTDLHHCNVYAKPPVGAEVKSANLAATKATGGGTLTTQITGAAGAVYIITASCTDTVGNESKRSVSKSLDALAPAEPQ